MVWLICPIDNCPQMGAHATQAAIFQHLQRWHHINHVSKSITSWREAQNKQYNATYNRLDGMMKTHVRQHKAAIEAFAKDPSLEYPEDHEDVNQRALWAQLMHIKDDGIDDQEEAVTTVSSDSQSSPREQSTTYQEPPLADTAHHTYPKLRKVIAAEKKREKERERNSRKSKKRS